MYEEEIDLARNIAREVCEFFRMPIPQIIITSDIPSLGMCIDTTVYLKPGIVKSKPEVLIHELAHVSHNYYGIPCRTPECEAFAILFEKLWEASRTGQRISAYYCPVCGYPLLQPKCLKCGHEYLYNSGTKLRCEVCGRELPTGPNIVRCSCGAVYAKKYRHPQEITVSKRMIGVGLGTALGGALLGAAIYGKLPPKDKKEAAEVLGAFTASGFVGLLAALIARRG